MMISGTLPCRQYTDSLSAQLLDDGSNMFMSARLELQHHCALTKRNLALPASRESS